MPRCQTSTESIPFHLSPDAQDRAAVRGAQRSDSMHPSELAVQPAVNVNLNLGSGS